MKPLLAPALALLAIHAAAATAAPSDAPIAELERRYLECDRIASTQILGAGDAAACSVIAERLLQQRFGGDFDRLLQWWRSARTVVDAAPTRRGHEAAPTRRVDEPVRKPFEAALFHYDAGQYAEAYALFAELADCGHREAARIALQMLHFGPDRYGVLFEASPQRVARWHGALSAESQLGPAGCTAA